MRFFFVSWVFCSLFSVSSLVFWSVWPGCLPFFLVCGRLGILHPTWCLAFGGCWSLVEQGRLCSCWGLGCGVYDDGRPDFSLSVRYLVEEAVSTPRWYLVYQGVSPHLGAGVWWLGGHGAGFLQVYKVSIRVSVPSSTPFFFVVVYVDGTILGIAPRSTKLTHLACFSTNL